jgi:hypothetical protein
MAHRRPPRLLNTIGCEQLERRDCPAAMFSLELPQSPILEGDIATFTVRLSERSNRPERVLISTTAETATLGKDYFLQNGVQLLFAPGDTVKTFTIRTNVDSLAEGIETFRLEATPLNRPASQRLSAAVRIWDIVPTSLTVTGGSIVEGNDGRKNATFELTLTGSPILPVTVQYATRNGTATAGSDYEAVDGSLTFTPDRNSIPAPTQYKKTITVPIIGDYALEADETFVLVVSNVTRGTTIQTPETVFTIRNDENDTPGFQFKLIFQAGPGGEVPESVRNAARQAAARWSRIITGDVPGVTVMGGVFIDDYELIVQMGLLGGAPEGPGGVLANAAPMEFRDRGNGLPYIGITGIDPNDINAGDSFLIDVLAHEMGHALGFTPGANVFNRWIVGDTFTGANAVREFNATFGRADASVPLQAGVRAHWDDDVFGNELMTPFVNNVNRISRVTIGALADMGYTVNYAAAENYIPPLIAMPPSATRPMPVTPPPSSRGPASPTPTPPPRRGIATKTEPPARRHNAVAAMAIEQRPAVTPPNSTGAVTPEPGEPLGFARITDAFRSLGRRS